MSAHVCGLDVHKKYTYATILGPDGEILAQKKMDNEEVPAFLEPYPVEHVAMEATTSIAPLPRRLTGMGYEVHVAHPKKTRTIAEARIKTDRTSSRALVHALTCSWSQPLRASGRRVCYVGPELRLEIWRDAYATAPRRYHP